MDDSPSPRGKVLREVALHPRLPTFVSLALLVYQIGLMWIPRAFPTQDGASHVYNAVVIRDLLFRADSPYGSLYELNRFPTPAWTSYVLLGVANLLVGPLRAEQALATLAILLLYAAFYYTLNALSPRTALLWPGLNALLNVWFLYMGFYNFYLAVALAVFCVGYYIKHLPHTATRHYIWIGLLMVVLYFTHPMLQLLAGLALLVVFVWDKSCRPSGRSLVPLLASMVPGALLLLLFLRRVRFVQREFALPWTELGSRLLFFPADLFSVRLDLFSRRVGEVICVLLLVAIVASVALWKKANWLSAQGGVLAAAAVMFGLYLIAPDEAAGGAFIKLRWAWIILVFSALAASVSVRSHKLAAAAALVSLPLVGAQLFVSTRAIRSANQAMEPYRRLEQEIRPGSTLLRLKYAAAEFEDESGLSLLSYDPLLHAVDAIAIRKQCLNWSNYEALAIDFPVVFRSLTAEDKVALQEFEDEEEEKAENLQSFLARLGQQVDYVFVYGELPEPGERSAGRPTQPDDFREALALLHRKYDLIGVAGEPPMLRLYGRKP